MEPFAFAQEQVGGHFDREFHAVKGLMSRLELEPLPLANVGPMEIPRNFDGKSVELADLHLQQLQPE